MNKFDFGQYIRNARESRKLEIDFCSANLKIHKKFLEAIENNKYDIFISYFQAQGFVQNYLEFLDLSVTELIPRWRKDFYEAFSHESDTVREFYKPKKKRVYNFSLTLSGILYLFLGTLVVGSLIWVFISYQALLNKPYLEIFKPKTNEIVDVDLIDIFGKTESDAILKVNNEGLIHQADGNFSTSLKLSEGINNFKFTAINPYGKDSELTLVIIYRPKKIEIYNPPVENRVFDTKPQSTLTQPVSSIPAKILTTKPAVEVKTTPKSTLGN